MEFLKRVTCSRKSFLLDYVSAASVYDILRPIYYCSFVPGMTAFDVKSEEFKCSRLSLIWNIIVAILVGAAATNIPQFSQAGILSTSIVYNMLEVAKNWGLVMTIEIIVILAGVFGNKIVLITKELHKLDQTLQKLNFLSDMREGYISLKLKVVTFTSLTTISIICINLILAVLFNMPKTTVFIDHLLVYHLPLIYICYMSLQYCFLLMVIKQRYEWLNQGLTKLAADCSKTKILQFPSSQSFARELTTTLKTIQEKHLLLRKICKAVNDTHGFQILSILFVSLITYLVRIYYVVQPEPKKILTKFLYPRLRIFSSWSVFLVHTTHIFAIVFCSSGTAAEAMWSGHLVHNIYFPSKSVQTQILNFSTQILRNKVEFKICNLFILNEEMLASFIGTIITFLITVVQLDMDVGDK